MLGWRSRPGSRTGGARSLVYPLVSGGTAVGAPHLCEEDHDLRCSLDALGPAVRRELQDVLTWPQVQRDVLQRSLISRPKLRALAQLLALTDTDRVARHRLLRALRDLEA
jgi:hypothetical protein